MAPAPALDSVKDLAPGESLSAAQKEAILDDVATKKQAEKDEQKRIQGVQDEAREAQAQKEALKGTASTMAPNSTVKSQLSKSMGK